MEETLKHRQSGLDGREPFIQRNGGIEAQLRIAGDYGATIIVKIADRAHSTECVNVCKQVQDLYYQYCVYEHEGYSKEMKPVTACWTDRVQMTLPSIYSPLALSFSEVDKFAEIFSGVNPQNYSKGQRCNAFTKPSGHPSRAGSQPFKGSIRHFYLFRHPVLSYEQIGSYNSIQSKENSPRERP